MFSRRTRKAMVRLHLYGAAPSLEGILVDRVAGLYILELPKFVESESASISIEGRAEVPERNVMFVQVLAQGG